MIRPESRAARPLRGRALRMNRAGLWNPIEIRKAFVDFVRRIKDSPHPELTGPHADLDSQRPAKVQRALNVSRDAAAFRTMCVLGTHERARTCARNPVVGRWPRALSPTLMPRCRGLRAGS